MWRPVQRVPGVPAAPRIAQRLHRRAHAIEGSGAGLGRALAIAVGHRAGIAGGVIEHRGAGLCPAPVDPRVGADRLYQKVRDILALSEDYDARSPMVNTIYAKRRLPRGARP